MTYCKYCGAPIVWIKTPAGKSMPCDAALVAYKQREGAHGRVVLKNGEVIAAITGMGVKEADGLAYVPHWGWCWGAKREMRGEEHEQEEQTSFL